jgi:SIR2-like domain
MTIELHDQAALIDVVSAGAPLPMAFLVGSPLSWDDGGGVPGVADILALAKEVLGAKFPQRLGDFETTVKGLSGPDAYQAAMRYVHGRMTQSGVNEVIRRAVLKARLPSAPLAFQGDGQPTDWYLPKGAKGLAELLVKGGERFLGPLITTNFDPLLSMSIRASGGHRKLTVIDTDGRLPSAVETDPGEIDVVHLHGYWRAGSTLHTPTQLTSERRTLSASLRRLLQQRTLVVIAYSGWDDVFTRALVEVLQDAEAQVTVLWCFRESDSATVQSKYGALLGKAQAAITSGALHLYGGIDCHSIFGEISQALNAAVGAPAAQVLASPMPGWELITSNFLGDLPKLDSAEAVRYFDGANPSWRHAASIAIPRRHVLSKITTGWPNLPDGQCSFQLIRAAGGEGKSTLLMQAAVEAVTQNDWGVLFRPTPQAGLSPDVVIALDENKQWLIVIDDADNVVESIYQCLSALHRARRANVDFLVAARDTDWHSAGGDSRPWGQLCAQLPDVVLRGIEDEVDARAIVKAWAAFGDEGLRGLANRGTLEMQTAALRRSVNASPSDRNDGSLLGGLLDVRFSPQALRNHVRELLTRLGGQIIKRSSYTLQDALVFVAACHSAGIAGINANVLADLLKVPREWLNSLVIRPLGDEASGAVSGGQVFTRHRKVADAVLAEAELNLGVDLGEVWAAIIKQTVKTGESLKVGFTHGAILHIGPNLERVLPSVISEDRRREIAIAAAKSAAKNMTSWLGCIVDFGKTYRNANMPKEAAETFRSGLGRANMTVDYAEVVRGYWYEWGVCEGRRIDSARDPFADAWLQSLSLSDHLNPAPITLDRVKFSCSGLGVAFGKLAQAKQDCPFALARRAAAWLGRRSTSDSRATAYFDNYDREADRLDTPKPKNLPDALDWLRSGAAAAGLQLTDARLIGLTDPNKLSFEHLRILLAK